MDRTKPRPLYTRENTVSISWRLDRPRGWSDWVRRISSLSEVDPQTVQPIADRCTNYAIPTTLHRKESYRNACTTDYSAAEQGVQAISCHRLPGRRFGMRHSQTLPFSKDVIDLFHRMFRSTCMGSQWVPTINRHNL